LKKSSKRSQITLKVLHSASAKIFQSLGFKWEVRRRGELKIGLWRKSWQSAHSGSRQSPKRLVVVPGFGDTPLSWVSTLLFLTPVIYKNYDELILLDFPGFGGFLNHEKAFHSLELMMEATSDVFDSLQPHTILGHSLGGWLTSRYAIDCGKKLRPKTTTNHFIGPLKIILTNPSGVITNREKGEAWRESFQEFFRQGFNHLRPHIFAREPFWFRALASDFGNFLTRPEIKLFMDSIEDKDMLTDHLDHLACEVWLLWGEKDTLVPIDLSKDAWVKLEKKVNRILIQKSGHTPQIERPLLTVGILARILSDQSVPGQFLERWKIGFNRV
jgi:pimeloyl-ACP methyl ester carboxylesterase